MNYEKYIEEAHNINKSRSHCAEMLRHLVELPNLKNKDMELKRKRLIQDCIKMEYYFKGLLDGLMQYTDKE